MNLDAFWARARSTVNQNTRRIKQTVVFPEALGLSDPFEHSGPYPFFDHCGYEIAACILMQSRRPGRHGITHTQYETIRELRSTYSSHIRSLPVSNINNLAIVDQRGRYTHLGIDKCGSLWFIRFMIGLKYRMGNVWKPNKGLSHQPLLTVIWSVEERILEAEHSEEEHKWILRGNEVLMLELRGLRDQLKVKKQIIA